MYVRQEENDLRGFQRAVLCACGLLLKVTKELVNHGTSLSAYPGKEAKLDWPHSWPY